VERARKERAARRKEEGWKVGRRTDEVRFLRFEAFFLSCFEPDITSIRSFLLVKGDEGRGRGGKAAVLTW